MTTQTNHAGKRPADKERIIIEAIHQRVSILRTAWFGLPIVTLMLVAGLWWLTDRTLLLEWLLCASITPIVRHLHVLRYFTTPPDFTSSLRWTKGLTKLALADGLIWGVGSIIFFNPDSVPEQVLFLTMLITIVAGSIQTSSYWPPSLYAFAIPAFSLAAIPFLQQGTPASIIMAVAMMFMLAVLYILLQTAHRLTLETIALRFENLDLVEGLREQKKLADDANLAKSRFLAAASHDLRQPIHAQGLFLEVLSRTALNDHQKELLSNSRSASEASSELLNALLDFSRIEAGVVKPQMQPFRLQSLLNKIETELAPQANSKDIVYRTRDTALSVSTDPMLLERILRNLVSNAIRYTERGGVLVACRQRGTRAVLEVWDTGIGIAPEHQKEVFREFHQLGNPERDRHKGLGLGLAIADGLARSLGHDLSLSSIPQRGSVFRLSLEIDNTIQDDQSRLMQSKPRLLNARILIVDDDEFVRKGMQHLLRDWGCECESAESIEVALDLASRHKPEVIICDYRLRENRTGVEAICIARTIGRVSTRPADYRRHRSGKIARSPSQRHSPAAQTRFSRQAVPDAG